MKVNEEGVRDRALAELQQMPPIALEVAPIQLLAMCGAVQLALRHPQFPDEAGRLLRMTVKDIQDAMPPGIADAIERGWTEDPGFFVPR